MILLLFRIENDIYGINLSKIIEVIPLVSIKKMPHSPEYTAGIINFRGEIVPVIDITSLVSGRLSKRLLSTRIIIINFPDRSGVIHKLGILAEQVTETMICSLKDFQPPGYNVPDAPYLGDLMLSEKGMVQMVLPEKLIPDDLLDFFFSA